MEKSTDKQIEMNVEVPREEPQKSEIAPEHQLLLDIEGFEGPIDLLLNLARDNKLDLTHISILELARQYLVFIETAQSLRLELAADYLVMAAWLTFLKSRLLIPQEEVEEDEPTGAEMAEALAFQLRRLEALQKAATELFEKPQLGQGVFARGMPENIATITKPIYDVGLYEMLGAYGNIQRRKEGRTYHIKAVDLYSIEEAYKKLKEMLGVMPGWRRLSSLVPQQGFEGEKEEVKLMRRSALASYFLVSLEMAKEGRATIRQDGLFQDIFLKSLKIKED